MNISFAPLDPVAADFLSEATNVSFRGVDFTRPEWFCVSARDDDDLVMGVLACQFKEWFDVHFSCAIRDRRCMSRRLLRAVFKTLFSHAVRITALVSPDNASAIEQVRRMGFVYEGFRRLGVEGRRDALEFGMLAEDCRFLPGFDPSRTSLRPIDLGGFHGIVS